MNPLNNLSLAQAPRHGGVERVQQGAGAVADMVRDGKTHAGATVMYLAAAAAAIVVFATQLVQTWSEASLLVSLLVLSVAAFLLLASLARPLEKASRFLQASFKVWSQNRRQAAEHDALMALAATDPRLMTDLRCVMGRDGN